MFENCFELFQITGCEFCWLVIPDSSHMATKSTEKSPPAWGATWHEHFFNDTCHDSLLLLCLKKNLNASKLSEHPPGKGGQMSKRSGGSIDRAARKDKNFPWRSNMFPNGGSIDRVNCIISGRNSPLLYCFTLIILDIMQVHQNKGKNTPCTTWYSVILGSVLSYCYYSSATTTYCVCSRL